MVQTCAEMLNLDELEENDAETFSIYGNWGHNVAEIGAEGKIQHFIYNLFFTTTAATEYFECSEEFTPKQQILQLCRL